MASNSSRVRVWWVVAAFLGGLILAGAGTATAAKMINGASIKNNTVTAKKLTKKVRKQLKKAGPAGPAGPQGPTGAQGPQGVPGPATGSAGGALTGSFPNPGIAAGAVGPDQLSAVPVTRVEVNTSVEVNSGSAASLPCNTVELTTDATMYQGTPGTLVAPRDGVYVATASVQLANSNSTGTRTVTIYEGQSSVANRLVSSRVPGTTADSYVTATAPLARRAGQPVTFWVSQDSGQVASVRPVNSFCSLQWVSDLPD